MHIDEQCLSCSNLIKFEVGIYMTNLKHRFYSFYFTAEKEKRVRDGKEPPCFITFCYVQARRINMEAALHGFGSPSLTSLWMKFVYTNLKDWFLPKFTYIKESYNR